MASASITKRKAKDGSFRYVVRYRLGGRAYPIQHAGSFKLEKLAKERLKLVNGELVACRNPAVLLRSMIEQPTRRTLTESAGAYKASRVDYALGTAVTTSRHLAKILDTFGERDPFTITPSDVREWIGSVELKPSSLRQYVATFRQLLDFCGVYPNPARDKQVRLPAVVTEEPVPPTAKQFLAMLDNAPARHVLPLVTLEQTAMRVGEVVSLTWGDVDVAESRFRLSRSRTKTRAARWVQVPRWLMDELEVGCPLEDRIAERRVFLGFTDRAAKNAMARACVAAKVPHMHPHDLRHRRLSLWHGQGVPPAELAKRAGHSKASMTLDVYSHVMSLEECDQGALEAAIEPIDTLSAQEDNRG